MSTRSHVDTNLLHKASISYDYLHTNSTTHEFLFGAIAELVDNARDANAKNLTITIAKNEKDEPDMLSFLDDGCGMTREQAEAVMSFGLSFKKMEKDMIGKYGNGLKSGAMRIAKDFIMFTRKGGEATCLFLSRTFHEKNNLKEVFVPTPSFYSDAENPRLTGDKTERQRLEMKIINEFSPYKTERAVIDQLERLGEEGTCIVLFNLRRIESGDTELDFKSEQFDIKLSSNEKEREPERDSLRAYLSVLYIAPRMKIYLRGKKVITQQILASLHLRARFKYTPKNIKACALREIETLERQYCIAKDMHAQAKSEVGILNAAFRDNGAIQNVTPELRKQSRIINSKVLDCKEREEECGKRLTEAKKNKNKPTPLEMFFGLNIHHRNRYGCMIYNNGRLIEMYVKTEVQKRKPDEVMSFLGLICLIDVPYSVLAPTHNKQSFENKREHTALMRSINEHMEFYWDAPAIHDSWRKIGIKTFWEQFGYGSYDYNSECNDNPVERRVRYQKTGYSAQCDNCLQWRQIEFQNQYMNEGIPDNWCCAMHPNSMHRNCNELSRPIKVIDMIFRKTSKGDNTSSSAVPQTLSYRDEPEEPVRAKSNGFGVSAGVLNRRPSDAKKKSRLAARAPARQTRESSNTPDSEEEDELEERHAKPRPIRRESATAPIRKSASSTSSRVSHQPARQTRESTTTPEPSNDDDESDEPRTEPQPKRKRQNGPQRQTPIKESRNPVRLSSSGAPPSLRIHNSLRLPDDDEMEDEVLEQKPVIIHAPTSADVRREKTARAEAIDRSLNIVTAHGSRKEMKVGTIVFERPSASGVPPHLPVLSPRRHENGEQPAVGVVGPMRTVREPSEALPSPAPSANRFEEEKEALIREHEEAKAAILREKEALAAEKAALIREKTKLIRDHEDAITALMNEHVRDKTLLVNGQDEELEARTREHEEEKEALVRQKDNTMSVLKGIFVYYAEKGSDWARHLSQQPDASLLDLCDDDLHNVINDLVDLPQPAMQEDLRELEEDLRVQYPNGLEAFREDVTEILQWALQDDQDATGGPVTGDNCFRKMKILADTVRE